MQAAVASYNSSTFRRVPSQMSVTARLAGPQWAWRSAAARRAPHLQQARRSRAAAVNPRADANWDGFDPSHLGPALGAGTAGRSTVSADAQQIAAHSSSCVRHFDHLVLGSGIAGLSYALKVAEYGSVAIITKGAADDGCTRYAQGGVCAVLDAADSVDSHVQDTIVAGAFLNDFNAVDAVCREGPARVMELVRLGADFTRNADGSLHLTREGGHAHRRIVHAADLTGAEIERALLAAAHSHPHITFFEHHLATELIVDEVSGALHCFGVDALDVSRSAMVRFLGLATMLATGGAGQVYPSTTNPLVATGDGMAMAYRAGAAMSNLEFVQFHPTALYSPPGSGSGSGSAFLITEAVRGEGGLLYNMSGERFMPDYDSRMELAPRDIVARAIQDQMLTRSEPHVLLDISHKPAKELRSHFPNIAARCAEDGIDITRDPIPVLPAQHYMCGGVVAGLRGETSVQGLFACGEVACSGLHGANRLASNSLLEGLVFADRAAGPAAAHAEYAARHCSAQLRHAAAAADFTGARAPRRLAGVTADWAAATRAEVRSLMWEAAGIVRTSSGLAAAQARLAAACVEVRAVSHHWGVAPELVELLNLVTVAELVVSCALQRRESRGLHYNLDHPRAADVAVPSVISSSLSARYDVDALRSSSAAAAAAAAATATTSAATGGRAGGALTLPASNGFVSLIAPGSGRGSSGGSSSTKKKAQAPSSSVRDLSVRSLPEAE